MAVSKEDLDFEKKYLKNCLDDIKQQINELGKNLEIESKDLKETRKFIWENKGSMDPVEIRSNLLSSELEYYAFERHANYLKKLYRVKESPYFGRIDFVEDENNINHTIYIGITHLAKDNNNLIYDWRAPISSLFYDYEGGKASYIAPEGKISGLLTKKRQYKIKNEKLVHIFDNNINVTDEFLQEILSNTSNDKMKNIVNTIQKEQNEVIRNTDSKNLIVQGIAGSGKTSVALHRIAFLLYKLENINSNNILIFSPNNIFSEYISNVLPELGETNALDTTFSDFAKKYITKYNKIESFSSFIERYYTNSNVNKNLTTFKMSDEMIDIIDQYVEDLLNNVTFTNDIEIEISTYEKEYLNQLFHDRYAKVTLFERIELIAEHICNRENKRISKVGKTIQNILWKNLNVSKDIKVLFKNLFKSDAFIKKYNETLSDNEINKFINQKTLFYEDSLLLIYLQGKLQSFPYSSVIKQVVIDEAQDYSKLQYIILKKIFPYASYTVLGDINQNINPYYKYNSLYDLKDILGDTKYVELNKTYRSSPEIIEYTNKIMGLKHAVSIRHSNNFPVICENPVDLYAQLKDDIKEGQKHHKKIAIVTKNNEEAKMLYDMLKNDFEDINYLSEYSENFNHNLVIIPSYLSKGLEFDLVIVYTDKDNKYKNNEKNLYYVVTTRAQHQLKIYNQI
ncbi:MAG TPA: UvrD-helicase domain-containing protein [Mollicutes bacterium]|nr:UvrD-helicase domain-containing protein [Mollicutes bacterium]